MQSGSLPYSGYVQASEHGRIRLYQWDCMELLRQTPDKHYSLCIVDPPYGIGAASMNMGKDETRYRVRTKHIRSEWDSAIPGAEYFNELFRVSRACIIWGGNYFTEHLAPVRNWIIWDKGQAEGMSFAMHEMAWCSMGGQPRIFHLSHATESNREFSYVNRSPRTPRIHPTQKPVALYRWLLQNYAKPGWKILDTHGGSMSIAIACDIEGYDLDICELDKDYFEAGKNRFEDHMKQPRLFDTETTKAIPQPELFTESK